MKKEIVPFSLKDTPALIERLLPVQKLSAEAYREQEGKQGKTLTTLGSYWKGRKPLILNRACIMGCLLPTTDNPVRDLELFEMLLAMDDESMAMRLGLTGADELPAVPYRQLVDEAKRPDDLGPKLHAHIWSQVNEHFGTASSSIPEFVAQLGVMRWGHTPRMGDAFCGSGQIPFEAARLGCEVYASDLNPIALMLTWGARKIVGASKSFRNELWEAQQKLVGDVLGEITSLAIETDGRGWTPKTFLYCTEVVCPQTGWKVPVLPTRLLSKGRAVIAVLVPNFDEKRFGIEIRSDVPEVELNGASEGTLFIDGRGQEPYLKYTLNDSVYKTKISTLRGDQQNIEGGASNRLRQWEKFEFKPREDDCFQERLYAIQWMRQKEGRNSFDYEFRTITPEDLVREQTVEAFVARHINEWQESGILPDLKIEAGDETARLQRERGWTYWHHLFSPRQLLFLGLTGKHARSRNDQFTAPLLVFLARLADWSSKLCRYGTGAARESVAQTFYNQALNTLFSYAVRSFSFAKTYLLEEISEFPITTPFDVLGKAAHEWDSECDLFVTDPPYGDAVKYEEILEFFIAWLRKNPPTEFERWVWDSRRAVAIKGEDEEFRRGMVSAYKRLNDCMPATGIQVIMFTHQSGSIWADMANIVWASGLRVTAAWYVVTETDSALREGSYVKGTVLLVLRKRSESLRTHRDDLAWEIKEEVEKQVSDLTGLNQQARSQRRDENVFEDADLQMAGYAAALRVLTNYSVIDGREMAAEAIRPRIKGQVTFVDELIAFAVSTANQALVPSGISKTFWEKLAPAERFYLKMIDMESRGAKTLDNYQNFAKAFKVKDFLPFMASKKANDARLKSAVEFGRSEMSETSEFYLSPVRATLYALMELVNEIDVDAVAQHLSFNVKDYLTSSQPREMIVALADYLAAKVEGIRPEEASAARVLRDLVRNQRLG